MWSPRDLCEHDHEEALEVQSKSTRDLKPSQQAVCPLGEGSVVLVSWFYLRLKASYNLANHT